MGKKREQGWLEAVKGYVNCGLLKSVQSESQKGVYIPT